MSPYQSPSEPGYNVEWPSADLGYFRAIVGLLVPLLIHATFVGGALLGFVIAFISHAASPAAAAPRLGAFAATRNLKYTVDL